VIPPKQNAKFVAQMETVLDLYHEPYDPARPVVCLDERPCVLRRETREPLPMQPGQPARYDHEFAKAGSCCLFMAFEPLAAWRRGWVYGQRRRWEFAEVVRTLAEEVYPEAEQIRLVCDNLNTHSAASFYERFAPEQARRLARRVEFIYTPTHGSWLNMVEIELSVLVRQCLRGRIGSVAELAEVVAAWSAARNVAGATVRWQMTTADARIKLHRLYPSLSV
jgi:hypothetical protein